jgi:small-conductance mechanosensitive channel
MNLEDTTAEECQVEEAAGVLKRLTERLELAMRGKRQALASQVPAIKRFFEEKREAVKVDIENQIEIINRTRAALLKEIQKLYEIDAKAVKLNAELNGIVRENGEKVNEYQTGSLIEGQFYLTDDWVYFGKDTTAEHLLGIPQWMVQDAKRGIIPQPLKKYFD